MACNKQICHARQVVAEQAMAVQGHGRCGVRSTLHDFDISARTDRQRRRGNAPALRDQGRNAKPCIPLSKALR